MLRMPLINIENKPTQTRKRSRGRGGKGLGEETDVENDILRTGHVIQTIDLQSIEVWAESSPAAATVRLEIGGSLSGGRKAPHS